MLMSSKTDADSELYKYSDITVIGGGPAGLILAYSCLNEGFSVSVIDKDPSDTWYQKYCFWKEEIQSSELPDDLRVLLEDATEKSWDSALARINDDSETTITSSYCMFNTKTLQKTIQDKIVSLGGRLIKDSIKVIEHKKQHSIAKGLGVYISKVVVVSNGSASELLSYKESSKPAFQVAYGQLLNIDSNRFGDVCVDSSTAGFMDYQAPLGDLKEFDKPPSFIYTLPMTQNQVFLEETILATRDDVEWSLLKNRLDIRKRELNLTSAQVVDEEYCKIQMGGGLPEFGRTLSFGAAAGFTHPVTGFQMTRSIRTAPRLARALKIHWDSQIDVLCTSAWESIWTTSELRNRNLYLLGLDILTNFNLTETQYFFEAFFTNSEKNRSHFLSGWGDSKCIEASMWKTFTKASLNTKRLIIQHSIRHPKTLFTTLFGQSNLELS